MQLCNGAVTIAAGSQNYGDTQIRAKQPFAGDTLEVSMTLGPDNRLAGWPQIILTSEPMAAPSYYGDNGKAATPAAAWRSPSTTAAAATSPLNWCAGTSTSSRSTLAPAAVRSAH